MKICDFLRFLGGSSKRTRHVTEWFMFTNMNKRDTAKRNAKSLEKENCREISERIMGEKKSILRKLQYKLMTPFRVHKVIENTSKIIESRQNHPTSRIHYM